jgi:hypothetical protein
MKKILERMSKAAHFLTASITRSASLISSSTYALCSLREQEPFDRLDRDAAGEQRIEPFRSKKFHHRPMMEADAAVTCEAEQWALQQRGPGLGTPILQNLGHIKRCLARVNAVGIGAMS